MKEAEILDKLTVLTNNDVLFDYDLAQIIKNNVHRSHMQDARISPEPTHEENIERLTKVLRDAIQDEINFTYDSNMVRCKIGRNDNKKSKKKDQYNFNEYQWTINLDEEFEINQLFTYYDDRPSYTRPYSLDGIDNFLNDLIGTSSNDITKNMAQQFFKQYIISVIAKNEEIVKILKEEEREKILKEREKILKEWLEDIKDEKEKKDEKERLEKLTEAELMKEIGIARFDDDEEKIEREKEENAELNRMSSIKYELYKILLNGKYTIKFVEKEEKSTSDGKSRRTYKTKSTKKSKSRRRYKTKSKSRRTKKKSKSRRRYKTKSKSRK